MRRSGPGARNALAGGVAGLAAFVALGPASCAHAPSRESSWNRLSCAASCAASCPRDAFVDPSGRCACAEGDVPMLGACVPPPVAAAFCGPAASAYAAGVGCAVRVCGAGESLDAVSGACVGRGSLPHGGSMTCDGAALPIVEDGHVACVPPDATCPRGATLRSGVCVRPPPCPAGTLNERNERNERSSCRSIVTSGGRSGTRVDVGAWAALVLGVDGGLGSPWLCQPLTQRPGAFADDRRDLSAPRGAAGADAGALPAASPTVRISVSATFPDQDVSRLYVEVEARSAAGRGLSPPAEAAVSSAVDTLFELLRGLGGEASAAAVGLEVTCALAPPR